MKLYLVLLHRLHVLLLWQREIDCDNAAKIVIEANEEIDRASAVLAHNTRLLEGARQKAADSWWRIERRGLLTRWGVKP